MAFTSIMFENPNTGAIKEAPVGFSWTTLFFGIFPPLFRGDYKWALIFILLAIVTLGLSLFIFPFFYNKLYVTDLIQAGYKAKSIVSGDMALAAEKLRMELPRLG